MGKNKFCRIVHKNDLLTYKEKRQIFLSNNNSDDLLPIQQEMLCQEMTVFSIPLKLIDEER